MEAGTDAEVMESAAYWSKPYFHGYLSLVIEPRTTSLRMAPTTIGWAHQSLIKKMPYSWTLWSTLVNDSLGYKSLTVLHWMFHLVAKDV